MINFFRKTRRKLANENKFLKYSRYAIGEVVLIMVGIFMALQLQNWNETRKQNLEFERTLVHLYSAIDFDLDRFGGQNNRLEYQIETIDDLINSPDSTELIYLPYVLFSLIHEDVDNYSTEVKYHAQNLRYNPNDQFQSELSKNVVNYTYRLEEKIAQYGNNLDNLLKKSNIAWPGFVDDHIGKGVLINDTYYTDEDLKSLDSLRRTKEYVSTLKSLKTQKLINKIFAFNREKDALSLIKFIKNYNPDIRLLVRDVGIIGTAIDGYDDVGAISTPMEQPNIEEDIWEIKIYLNNGTVKFRCRDSWNQNWGGNNFPSGTGYQDGPDIPVEEGYYHVILDANSSTYSFVELDKELIPQ